MQTLFAAIFVFLLVVTLHEFGHFYIAKKSGVQVNEFSIGMGPKIIQRKWGETMYSLRLFPIGGYAAMEGEDSESENPRAFEKATLLKRIAIVAAGPIMNYLLTIVLFFSVFTYLKFPTTIIESFTNNSTFQEAGALKDDKIIKIDNVNIGSYEDFKNEMSKKQEKVNVTVLRDKEEKNFNVKIKLDEYGNKILGFYPKRKVNILNSFIVSIKTTVDISYKMFDFLVQLVKGKVGAGSISGPIGVISEIGKAANRGFMDLIILTAIISLNLGFFNLLPIPALDGGRLLFLFIELIIGKKVPKEKEAIVHIIGFILLVSLIILVSYKDISKLIR